jgi:hypothetical protein
MPAFWFPSPSSVPPKFFGQWGTSCISESGYPIGALGLDLVTTYHVLNVGQADPVAQSIGVNPTSPVCQSWGVTVPTHLTITELISLPFFTFCPSFVHKPRHHRPTCFFPFLIIVSIVPVQTAAATETARLSALEPSR